VIRATLVSTIDQALLSALNFGLAFLLIHSATKDEYGLYAQLTSLQSFFSPIHAGIFVSAYLAIATRQQGNQLLRFRASMARSECVVAVGSALIVFGTCFLGGRIFGSALTLGTSTAFCAALVGLWWREFIRTTQFAQLNYRQALRVDAIYCAASVAATTAVATLMTLSVRNIFWCLALGAVIAAATPLISSIRGAVVDAQEIWRDLRLSWRIGQWDVLGSIVTWGYQQSYVYFAALHGGLASAAEISAARLLVTPLALTWTSYANVLRPRGSQLLSVGSHSELHRLAFRSSAFVVVGTCGYAIAMLAALPFLQRLAFANKYEHLAPLVLCWTIYICLTGLTTVASSVLRSALEFRQIFHRQVISCVAAIGLLGVGSHFGPTEIVIALIVVEAISFGMLWRRLRLVLLPQTRTAVST
jgi:O-antigen/teichoic acid export membrane protein